MAKNGDELVHVVIVGGENREAWNLFDDGAAGDGVEALGCGENGEHAMVLLKRACRGDETVDVVLEFAIGLRAGCVKINGAVLAIFVSAGGDAGHIFGERSFYWPDERMNRTENEHGCFFVPTRFAQSFAAVGIGMRFERPGGVCSEFRRDAEFAEHGLRFRITSDDQRIVNITRTHVLDKFVHVASFSAVADGQFIFRGRETE